MLNPWHIYVTQQSVELPAGLVDEGEDAALVSDRLFVSFDRADEILRTAALRELHEETGYGSGKAGEGNAEVGEVSSVLVKDPG